MRIEHDYRLVVKISGVRSSADMRRLFGNGWKTINESQRAWIRHLLKLWGQHLGNEEYDKGEINILSRLMMRCEWSEQKGKQIEKVVSQLYCEGYRGEELMRKARDLVVPQSSAANIIALAKESDDADFMERVITKTFGRDNPIRSVARLRYCKCKSSQDVQRSLSYLTGITSKEARNRMEWAESILEGELFYAAQRELKKETLQNAA